MKNNNTESTVNDILCRLDKDPSKLTIYPQEAGVIIRMLFDIWSDVQRAHKNDVIYICDGKACGEKCPSLGGQCKHTPDISHAVNFKYLGLNSYMEELFTSLEEEK